MFHPHNRATHLHAWRCKANAVVWAAPVGGRGGRAGELGIVSRTHRRYEQRTGTRFKSTAARPQRNPARLSFALPRLVMNICISITVRR